MLSDSEGSALNLLAHYLFERARTILQTDGHHGFFVFLVSPSSTLQIIQLIPQDQGDKYRMWREVAARVARSDAVGVIALGEVWVARIDTAHPLRHAAQSPDRTEGLRLSAISKDGEELALFASFAREGGRIILDETALEDPGETNFFEPVRRVWRGKEFPSPQ